MNNVYLGNNKMITEKREVKGEFVEIENEKFYKINNYNQIPDFFMSIVSDCDHWMYISSNGALSAGRKNRDNALFPYYTVDKIHDYKGKTGSKTICLVEKDGKRFLWEPFSNESEKVYAIERNIYKSIYGNKVIFEESNQALEVSFRYGWYNSSKYGWIKRAEIKNNGNKPVKAEILDGLRNILPYGVGYAFQNEFSNLSDAYKKSELLAESKIGLFLLGAIPVDRAEPSEALKATTVWAYLPGNNATYLISDNQVDNFRKGHPAKTESDIRAGRGAYYVNIEFPLGAGENKEWFFAADINKDAADVANLDKFVKSGNGIAKEVSGDIRRGTQKLVSLIANADGLQSGEEAMVCARHYTNTLFNIMRGGVFSDNYTVNTSDLRLYIKEANKELEKQFNNTLTALPGQINYSELINWATATGNTSMEKICLEYLPLTFSRRHGDPSRPWNRFSIEVKNDDGTDKLSYEGNWRDIFQNWEALGISFPEYIESFIAKFVNASTADGYNPYRITREGIDWECPGEGEEWANIGYWGDHQIIYLQKFLEQSENYHPGKLDKLLSKESFVYANVPYRIKSFSEIVENPKQTIVFDDELNRKIEELTNKLGADGKLLHNRAGKIHKVNLMEKILSTLLAKFTNFIPEAGIWLNTQRPEWNDANNALVGNGVSMVTLYYMYRFVQFWDKKIKSLTTDVFPVSEELKVLFDKMFIILKDYLPQTKEGFSDEERFQFAGSLGEAGSCYRKHIYNNSFSGKKQVITNLRLRMFVKYAKQYIEQSILKNRRKDKLFHSYNLVSFKGQKITIRHMYEMLEGQVAALSSGYLNTAESLEVMDALKSSRMFCEKQYSYLLYPDRQLKRFTEKNIIPATKVYSSKLMKKLLSTGHNGIIRCDAVGGCHFNGTFRNAAELERALDNLSPEEYGDLVKQEKGLIMNIYEDIFDHQSFTGRSGTFFGYEGLGSIYWHMVSKLLLAVQECYFKGVDNGAYPTLLNRLKEHYYEIKAGIGLYKTPELYGAFPTDAYSHTPANSGAKQPGLTGQVKEDIISRFGELGLHVHDGKIVFNTSLLNHNEFLKQKKRFNYISLNGRNKSIELGKNQLAYTFCQAPIVYKHGQKEQITIKFSNKIVKKISGNKIDKETSNTIFTRTGKVKTITFEFNK